MLVLRTLGQLSLRDDDEPRLAGRRKPLALLTYLARRSAGRVSRESLASMLWEESDRGRARQSLRQTLYELRSVVGPSLEMEEVVIHLPPGVLSVDVAEFESHIAASRWESAIAVWTGEFLEGCEELGSDSWRGWLETERASLRKQLAIAFDHAIAAVESRANWSAAVTLAEQWYSAMPWDEQACRRLIAALRSSGRVVEAASRHAACVERLRTEFETEPSADLLRLGRGLEQVDAPGAARAPGARAFTSPDMVGRGNAFETLIRKWKEVRVAKTDGAVVLITGDQGMGKTRLCEELARHVRNERGRHVLIQTHVFGAEREQAHSMLQSALSQLAGNPALASAPPEVLASLATIAPVIREHFRHLPAAADWPNIPGDFARALDAVASEVPLLLVVDDAPQADAQSAAALANLIRHPVSNALIVLAGSTEAWQALPLWADARHTAPHQTLLELHALTREDVLGMLSSMAPFESGDALRLASDLHRESGGNPSQLLQLITHLAERGVIGPDSQGQWRLARQPEPNDWSLPSTARDAIRQRLDRLNPAARRLAGTIAVAGSAVDASVLESISGLAPEEFRTALGELLVSRLVKESSSARGHYELVTEATRRAVYDLLPPSERTLLHFAVWRALRAMPWRSGDKAVLDYHRGLAGPIYRRVIVRRAAVGLAIAGLLAVGGVKIVRSRNSTVGPGTQVLLADVQNLTGDSILGKAVLTAATVGLQQSHYLSVFPRTRLAGTLALMKRPGADTLVSEELAREVAVRENVGLVIALAISRFDSAYLLTVRAVDPRTGRDLFTQSERAPHRREILTGLDRLVSTLRREIGESPAAVGANSESLPRVTTSSLEALQAYSEGKRAWTNRKYDDARDAFRRAIALDSTFALALASLADYSFFMNRSDSGNVYLDRAIASSNRLTTREQLALKLQTARYRGPETEAVRIATLIAERYPERDTWFVLGTTLLRQRHCKEAIPALRRAVALDPKFTNAHINIATCLSITADYPAAARSYEDARRIDSTALFSFNLNHEWGQALLHARGVAAAESAFVLMVGQRDPALQARGLRSLAYLRLLEGRFREARRLLDSAVVLTDEVSQYRNLLILGDASLTAGDTVSARRALRRAFGMVKSLSLDPFFLMIGGRAYARAGLIPLARETRTLTERAVTRMRADSSDLHTLGAHVELYSGNHRAALAELEKVRDTASIAFVHAVRADAYSALKRPDSALRAARAAAEKTYYGEETQDEWIRATLRVGRYSEALGDKATAREAYRRYVERWKNGDPEIPELIEAKRALARMTQ